MRLPAFIGANWQLKLLSLALALALLFWTSGQVRVERTLTVEAGKVTVQGLPADYQVASISPAEFTVDVDGPSTVMSGLRRDNVTPVLQVSAAALAQGRQEFPITNRVLGLEADISVRRVRPENVNAITLVFGKVVREMLAVEVPQLAEAIPGVEPTIALDRTAVTVSGPSAAIEQLRAAGTRVRFRPIRLPGASPLIERATPESVDLQPEPLPGGVTVVDRVTATVRLKPIAGTRQAVVLQVHVLAPPGFTDKFRIELSQPQVSVTLRGPLNLLNALQADEDVTAYINVRRLVEPIVYENVPVYLLGPAWLTHDPVAIRATLTLAGSGAGKPSP